MAEKEYIERSKAIEAIDDACGELNYSAVEEYNIRVGGMSDGMGTAIEIIEAIPAADVQPVVRAHWTDRRTIEHDGEWYCTACGKEITIYMGADRPDRYRFCPNCGARMEES